MYQTNFSTEKQTLTNGDSKLNKNKFTKSLTSFHTKKNISKNISSQNPSKKPGQIKQDKSVKNKRVYLSSKKVKALNYLKLNQISPQDNILYDLNKQGLETNQQNKVYNAPSSVQRSYKYKNCYILNNLNNYHPNVIPGSIIQVNNNKYTEIKLSDSEENNENIIDNNNSNSYSISENRKTNGASKMNDNNENNSLFQPSSVNGLNTITFNINNNYNNCYNNYNSNNNDDKGFSQFNGYMNANRFDRLINKNVSNSNDYLTINSREKIINKLEESDKDNIKDINIVLGNDNKVINNKRSNLFKGKSSNKIKSKQGLYSNTINAYSVTNFNNEKKIQKPTILIEKNESNDAQNYVYETVDNAINTNLPRTKNKYKFNNKMIINNQRNFDNKNNEIENTKSMNNTGSALKIQKDKNNDNYLDNKIKEQNQNTENTQYKTYSSSFRNNKNMIKVNMIETKKNNIINDNEDNIQYLNKPKFGFKNSNKSSNNLKTSLDKVENKNIFGCKKYNKKNNSQSNKKININNNNKTKYTDKNKINKNNLIQTYNNFKKDKEEEIIYENEDINQTNYNEQNYKNELQTRSVNCLDCYTKKSNIIPLTRENSITYIRKKSLNMKVYNNGDNNNNYMSSRPSTFKHKKNYSISSSVYNSQRYVNEVKIDLKNNKNNKKNIVYTPKNNVNNINEKTIVIPEYQIKLENIKSRINNLLNIYSLLALKSLNVPNGDNKANQDILDKNDGY